MRKIHVLAWVAPFSQLTHYKEISIIISYAKYMRMNISETKELEEGHSFMEEMSKAVEVVTLIKTVMRKIKHEIKGHFKEMSLTGPQGMLMGTLAHHGEMKVSDLSERLGLSNSTVSGILDRLENQGFVARTRSKEDRRVVNIQVTDEFRKHSLKYFEEINKSVEQMMEKATPEELDIIFKGMNTLEKVIDRRN